MIRLVTDGIINWRPYFGGFNVPKRMKPRAHICINTSTKSDYGSTSFVESEIIGMESFHKLNIPLIHLTTKFEKEDREEKESDRIIKSNSNTEFNFKPIINSNSMIPLDPNTISIKHETNPSTSNIIHYYFLL